nr:MAG TPA: hypothetical protein [Caudoviricetes sp.]
MCIIRKIMFENNKIILGFVLSQYFVYKKFIHAFVMYILYIYI